jgi:hypothetical protein
LGKIAMSFPIFFTRILSQLRLGAADPVYHFGTTYEGTYEPAGNRVSGFVTNRDQDKRFPPASVIVTRDGIDIGAATQLERAGHGWRFSVSFPELFTADDILRDRIRVFAVDYRGARSDLLIDGAVQLSYVREALAPPFETEVVIDFAEGGNSKEFVRAGWSHPEPRHTWTEGKQSVIELSFRSPGSRYRVEMLAWPFCVAGRLVQQAMLVSLDDTLLSTFNVGPGQKLLECEVAGDLTENGRALLRFDFPDAARPYDIDGAPEQRMIALAFRSVTLKRVLQAQSISPGMMPSQP